MPGFSKRFLGTMLCCSPLSSVQGGFEHRQDETLGSLEICADLHTMPEIEVGASLQGHRCLRWGAKVPNGWARNVVLARLKNRLERLKLAILTTDGAKRWTLRQFCYGRQPVCSTCSRSSC